MSSSAAAVCLLFSLLLFSSCTDDSTTDRFRGEIPDTVSENFRQVTVSPEGRVEIEAAKVEAYIDEDRTVFHQAGMRELDTEGNLVLEGGASLIRVSGDQDAEAEGDIHIHDVKEDSRLQAERLIWDDDSRLLTGTGPVSMDTGDGLSILGEGFQADLARKTFVYTDGVEGTLEVDEVDEIEDET